MIGTKEYVYSYRQFFCVSKENYLNWSWYIIKITTFFLPPLLQIYAYLWRMCIWIRVNLKQKSRTYLLIKFTLYCFYINYIFATEIKLVLRHITFWTIIWISKYIARGDPVNCDSKITFYNALIYEMLCGTLI